MAEFSSPGFRTLRAALLCDNPTDVTVDVTLSGIADSEDQSGLVFHDSVSLLAKFALLHLESSRRLVRALKDSLYWKAETGTVEESLHSERQPILRQELIIQYDELQALKSPYASADSVRKWILEIPSTSPAWVYHFNLALTTSLVYRSDALNYISEIIALHPSKLFAEYLYKQARVALGIKENRQSTENRPSKARPQVPVCRVGDAVPHFDLCSIDDPSKVLSDKSMKGRIYLIEFWATWCGPCVAEMPNLHKAFERFKGSEFTILSVSEDDSASTVSRYRKQDWPMPWQHALASSQLTGSAKWSFGAWWIPFSVLVSSKGRILAMGDDLKGKNLQGTLEKFIKR
jgi:thiol-disulfide isomerase/thioredoxin